MSGTKTGVSYFCIRNRIAVQIQNLPVENNLIGKDSVEQWRSRPAGGAEEQNSRKRSRDTNKSDFFDKPHFIYLL